MMSGTDNIIEILAIIAGFAFSVGFVYWMCRTCFDWKKAAYLYGFLAISAFIWGYLSSQSAPSVATFAAACKSYPMEIHECNGWLFTHDLAYSVALKIKKLLNSTELAQGQALIAGFVIVAIALMEYSKSILKGGITALAIAAVVVVATFMTLTHISDIQHLINQAFDVMISFGKFDHEKTYTKLATYFDLFQKVEFKFNIFDTMTITKVVYNNLILVFGLLFRFMYGLISWANVVMFAFQSLTIMFIPSMCATAIINFKTAGPRAATMPLVFISGAVIGRIFIVAQMGCIAQIDIDPNFDTLVSQNWTVIIDFIISYFIALIALLISIVTMFIFVFKLVWGQVFSPTVQALF